MVEFGKEPESSKDDDNFEFNPNLTNLNPANNETIEAEHRMEAFVESQYSKQTFTNPSTGRPNQVLSCRQCNHSTQILGNMKTHVRAHF